jgi:hypothetical protein
MDYIFWGLLIALLVAWYFSRKLRIKKPLEPQKGTPEAPKSPGQVQMPFMKQTADFIDTDSRTVIIHFQEKEKNNTIENQ